LLGRVTVQSIKESLSQYLIVCIDEVQLDHSSDRCCTIQVRGRRGRRWNGARQQGDMMVHLLRARANPDGQLLVVGMLGRKVFGQIVLDRLQEHARHQFPGQVRNTDRSYTWLWMLGDGDQKGS
jgi:hypothetical protein